MTDATEWFSATFLRLSDAHSLVSVEEIIGGAVRDRPDFEEALIAEARRALAGERVDGGFRLGLLPDPPPMLAIGALQPQMLRLAGREGDGVVLTSLGADDVAPLLERVAPQRPNYAVIAWVTVPLLPLKPAPGR